MGPGFESLKVHQWPIGQVVKTAASHAVNIGSNPVWVTNFLKKVLTYSAFDDIILAVRGQRPLTYKDGLNPIHIVGIDCDVGPPVPIPNTEVKHMYADDSCRVTGRENR